MNLNGLKLIDYILIMVIQAKGNILKYSMIPILSFVTLISCRRIYFFYSNFYFKIYLYTNFNPINLLQFICIYTTI